MQDKGKGLKPRSGPDRGRVDMSYVRMRVAGGGGWVRFTQVRFRQPGQGQRGRRGCPKLKVTSR